ncbi:MAG: PhoH family protein [Spirochaetes bacterium]|nr:PhoH family protein [Spirochaetota bacterium]
MGYSEETIFVDPEYILFVLGIHDSNIRKLEKEFSVSISYSDGVIYIEGEDTNIIQAKKVLQHLVDFAQKKKLVSLNDIDLIIHQAKEDILIDPSDKIQNTLLIEKIGKMVEPKTENQIKYFEELKKKTIIISYGPAGTGKTYIAVGYALSELLSNKFNKIILTRPVVEAGEKLGFLPGDFLQKINPYLKPLYDAIYDIVGFKTFEYLKNNEKVEIIPLAYMRGRTLNNSIIILDEAQNATFSQLKMFLTRFGFNSKVILTGDITQIDLPRYSDSGLPVVIKLFENLEDIALVKFDKKDVVRHPLIKKIIKIFEDYEDNRTN